MPIADAFRLDGRKLFITGGSRGLGREMALAIAEAGADVVLVGRDEESLEKTAGEIREQGRSGAWIRGDVGIPEECERVCREALAQHGPFDILINNVGGRRINVPLEEQSLADWQTIMDLNLTSTFLCMKHIGGAMLPRGKGRVINISSISAMVAFRGMGGRSYEAAKSAVVQLTKCAAADWAPRGVTVNAICPGGYLTEPNQRWQRLDPQFVERATAQIPQGVFGNPQDLGALAVYLASDASQYMTGAAIVIDGGYTAW